MPKGTASPTLKTDGSLRTSSDFFRIAPIRSKKKSGYRIEVQDYSGFSALPNKGSAILAGLL